MLHDPNFPNEAFSPSPVFFINRFDIFDREETLGEELAQYDPMKYEDIDALMREYYVSRINNHKYTNKHKSALVKNLKKCLDDPNYNFDVLVEHDYEDCHSLPWEISDARKFFTNIYKIMNKYWGNLDVAE